jgi:drug/metabolite transporter (DMT)-like permease
MVADQRSAGGVAAAVTVSLIWGLSFVAASVVLTTLSPVVLATLRFTLASTLFLPPILRELNRGSRPSMSDLRETAYLGFLSISLYFWLQYTGVKYSGAGISALLLGIMPETLTAGGGLLIMVGALLTSAAKK